MSDMATPLHKNPCPGDIAIYNFGRPFLCQYYYTLSLCGPCPTRVEKKIFYPKLPLLGMGAMIFSISCVLALKMPNLFKIGPVDIDGRRTTHDDGRQPIAIGHLSDSGDLKIWKHKRFEEIIYLFL